MIQPGHCAAAAVYWRGGCQPTPEGPIAVAVTLPGDQEPITAAPGDAPPYPGGTPGAPDGFGFRCDPARLSPLPRLDVGPFTPVEPPVTPWGVALRSARSEARPGRALDPSAQISVPLLLAGRSGLARVLHSSRSVDDSPPSPKLLAPVVMALLILVLLWVGQAADGP